MAEDKKIDWKSAAAALMAQDPRFEAAFSTGDAPPPATPVASRPLTPADKAVLDGIPDAPNVAGKPASTPTPQVSGDTLDFSQVGMPQGAAETPPAPTVMQGADGNMQLPQPQAGVPSLGALGKQNTAAQNQNLALTSTTKSEQQAANDAAAVQEGREAAAMQPTLDRQAKVQALANQGIADAHEKAFAMSQQIMGKWKDATDEMTKIAQQKPYEFWSNASSVDKFRAGLSIALGVVGGLADGSNVGVERIHQLVADEHAKQKSQFELWGKVAADRGNQYGRLVQMLGNEQLADAAFTRSLQETAKSQITAMANRFSSDRAKTKAAQLNAGIDAEGAKTFAGANDTAIKNGIELQKLSLDQQQLAFKSSQENDLPIDGIIGGIPKAEHPKLSAEAGGARALINVLNTAEAMLDEPGGFDKVRAYLVNSTSAFKGARDYIGTGTRIEAGEQSILDQYTPGKADAFISKFTNDLNGFKAKLHAAKVDVAGGMFTKIHTAAPRTGPDLQDPIWGQYLTEYLTQVVKHHQKSQAASKMQSYPVSK